MAMGKHLLHLLQIRSFSKKKEREVMLFAHEYGKQLIWGYIR